jgi:hypothetical protein
MRQGCAYFNGPNGLEECEVVIFDKLADLQSYERSVFVFRIFVYHHACCWRLNNCGRHMATM